MKAILHKMGGSGPPVLLIHGFGADRMTWMFLAPLLTSHFTVYAVDLPGHGEAPCDVGEGAIATLAMAVSNILPSATMAMIGHSMGGAICLELARTGFASQVVLIAPAGLGSAVADQFLTEFPEMQSEDDAVRVLGRLVSKKRLVTSQMAKYVLSELGKEGRREALRKVATGLRSVDPTIPHDVPVTLIWGAEDVVNTTPDKAPVADYHLLEGIGHLPHVEAVSRVASIIIKALLR